METQSKPMTKNMQYPLKEKIGNPDLLVGRETEFNNFAKWIDNIPKRLSKSRVILARRKSGKTAFVQRIFNQLWSKNSEVIPFYLDIGENKIWYPDFAFKYYQTFASHVISFFEQDDKLVTEPLSLEKIKEYGKNNSMQFFVDGIDSLFKYFDMKSYGLMWDIASSAPHRFAALHDKRVLVILDEFQNITQYVYPVSDFNTNPIETMAGSFHSLVESKIAPMLVTGSYLRWLINIINKYLEAGRLSRFFMSPCLTAEEGLQAVYKYAEVYNEPITNDTAVLINQLCMSDPFFISCIMESNYDKRDLTTEDGVIKTINYEITDRSSELSLTWGEYIELTLQRINDIHAKNILLYLSKHSERQWTPKELKEALNLDLSVDEIHRRLRLMVESDVIQEGVSDIDYKGLKDGTLNLILRNRFEKEITTFAPDFKNEFHEQIKQLRKDKQKLQGMLNNLSGMFAEYQLANEFRSRKRFCLSAFFEGVADDSELNIVDVSYRVPLQRKDGKKMELDIVAESSCGRVVVVEVKKRQEKSNLKMVEDFQEKLEAYSSYYTDKKILSAFLSLGGFTDEANHFCKTKGIAVADRIQFGFDISQ